MIDYVKTRTGIYTKYNKTKTKPKLECREGIYCLPDKQMHFGQSRNRFFRLCFVFIQYENGLIQRILKYLFLGKF